MTPAQQWQRWFDAGLVRDAQLPALTSGADASPWYIRLILGVCGWLGGLFLLAFLGFAWFSAMEETGIGVVGVVLIAIAYGLYRATKSELGEQFALALSLAGQIAIGVALFDGNEASRAWTCFAIGGLQLILMWVMPNPVHRSLSALFAVTALDFGFLLRGFPSPLPVIAAWLTAVFWMDESRWQLRLGDRLVPIASGVTLAGLLGLAPFAFQELGIFFDTVGGEVPLYLRYVFRVLPVVGALVWVWAGWRWTAQVAWRLRAPALLLSVLMAVAGWWMPGVSLGLLVLLLGFARGRPALMGLGAAAGLLHLSMFYYSLASTLLVKSISLAVLGAVLLAAAWVLPRIWQEVRDV